MAKYYYYDGTKDMGYHGYKTEKGVVKAAIAFLKEHPTRFVGVYEEHEYGGSLLGRLYYGREKGRKVIRYKTDDDIYTINGDGSVKVRDNTRYIATYYRQHGDLTDLNTARRQAAEMSRKNGYDMVYICKNYVGDRHAAVYKDKNGWVYEPTWQGKDVYFDPKTGKAVKGR